MQQFLFAEKIGAIQEELMLLLKCFRAAEMTDVEKYPETFARHTTDASIRA